MKELNYFPLNSESNIYGATKLEFQDGRTKLLVATLDCQIYCIEYVNFEPKIREVDFTYIPNGAKIVSIDALKRGYNDFAIGITHSLVPDDPPMTVTSSNSCANDETYRGRQHTHYLNIYASGSAAMDFDLDYVAQGCQTLRLRYVPYHLYNTILYSFDKDTNKFVKTPYWLLSGSDGNIHAFTEERPYHAFAEVTLEESFAELENVNNIVLWMDVMNIVDEAVPSYTRLIALGFEEGTVTLLVSNIDVLSNSNQLIRKFDFDSYNTIIPSVRFFQPKKNKESFVTELVEKKLLESGNSEFSTSRKKNISAIDLLVVSSTEHSLIFRDVLSKGLDDFYELPESKKLDCTLSSAIGDIDYDGYNELILGSHGQELSVYSYDRNINKYAFVRTREFNYPISAIEILDLTGDCMLDVALLLTGGILVLQASLTKALQLLGLKTDRLLRLVS